MLLRLALLFLPLVSAQYEDYSRRVRCAKNWSQFQDNCYRFVKSPSRIYNEAIRNCQAFGGNLVSLNSLEEYAFLIRQLNTLNIRNRLWFVGVKMVGGKGINEVDGSPIPQEAENEISSTHVPSIRPFYPIENNLAFRYSEYDKKWVLTKVDGERPYLFICEVAATKFPYDPADDRPYDYGIETTDFNEIPRGPYFVTQPQDVIYVSSTRNKVVLRCKAGGYPYPTYEWFKKIKYLDEIRENKIDTMKNTDYILVGGDLVFISPSRYDRGDYYCKATNTFGTIISDSASLTFGALGEFNYNRSPEEGKEHWGKALSCDAPRIDIDVSFIWTKDKKKNTVEESQRVFVSSDGTLYFSNVESIDQGTYACDINYEKEGRTGPLFTFNVAKITGDYEILRIPKFPKTFPEAPIAGRSLVMECFAYGYPTPSYNWTRVGAPLPKGAKLSSYNRVLTIPNVSIEDQGTYECTAKNNEKVITSPIELNLKAEPNFTIPLTDKHMDLNGELTWICEAYGVPDVEYSWYKNGLKIEVEKLPVHDRERYVIQDNVLTIRYLNPDRDPGMYQCMAKNILKAKLSSAQLRVLNFKPSFAKRPLEPETYAAEGGNATIVCDPEAAPAPKFTWRKSGIVIGSGGKRTILENGNLNINQVSYDDEGNYTCIAENTYGSDESSTKLVVIRRPYFIKELAPKIVTTVGKDLFLTCVASVDERLDFSYIWTHNKIKMKSTYRNFIFFGQNSIPVNETQVIVDGGNLQIRNISFAYSGNYECILKSSIGKIRTTQTEIVVEGPPGPPGGIEVSDAGSISAVLRWTDGATNGKPITKYIVSKRSRLNKVWEPFYEITYSEQIDRYNGRRQAKIEHGLSPYVSYQLRLQAVSDHGVGIPSEPSAEFLTLAAKPSSAPKNIRGGGGKIGDLVIKWDPLPEDEHNGPGLHYKIFWRLHETPNAEFTEKELKDKGNIGVAVIHVSVLTYYTKYDVKVQAINDVGPGIEPEVVTIYSAEDMPQVAPQQVSARSFNSTALNVSWIPIEQTREKIRGKLIGHRLKYWDQRIAEQDALYYLSRSTQPWALIVGLQPDTNYYVKVMAYNSAGEGPESEKFLEKTYRKAPQLPPFSVQLESVGPTTVRVTWRYIQKYGDEEPIIGYKVRVWETDQDMSTANDTILPTGSNLVADVTNLVPGKPYKLRVLAFSNGGDGRMSSPEQVFVLNEKKYLRSSGTSLHPFSLVVVLTFVSIFNW